MPAPPPSVGEQAAIRELRQLGPLPPESDRGWDAPDQGCWRDAELLIALADRSGENGWRRLAIEVFDYAADWDVFGLMLTLRRGPELAWAGDGAGMAAALEEKLLSERPGTLIWTARELGVLRMPSSIGPLAHACAHPVPAVTEAVHRALGAIAALHPAAGHALVEDQSRRGLPVLEVTVTTGAVDPEWPDRGRSIATTVHGRWLADTAALVTATLVLTDPLRLGPEQHSRGRLLPSDTAWNGTGVTLDAWESLSVTATVS